VVSRQPQERADLSRAGHLLIGKYMERWDIFISYKWNTYAEEAKTLKTIAVGRGFTAWLDVDHPFQTARYASEELDVALVDRRRSAIRVMPVPAGALPWQIAKILTPFGG
jgi:hypothetical protein